MSGVRLRWMVDRVSIDRAANGHVWLTTRSQRRRLWLGFLLMFRYGFWRWGSWVPPNTGEAVYPDFIRGGLRITAGWDTWVGYDLLSDNEATDGFLQRFFERHCR